MGKWENGKNEKNGENGKMGRMGKWGEWENGKMEKGDITLFVWELFVVGNDNEIPASLRSWG